MNPTKEVTKYIFDIRHTIGKQLKDCRLKQGLSLSEAAGKCGLSTHKVEQVELGNHFSWRSIALVAAIYGLKFDIKLVTWKKV